MTELRVAAAVGEAFPDVAVAAVVAEGVRGEESWPGTERLLAALEADAAAGDWTAPAETDPLLASWQTVYRAFGTNPRRFRPSMDALARRLARSGRLPRVSAAVDTYNVVSAAHHIPAGAFDLTAVRGDIELRFAAPGDALTLLGEPDTVEDARPGEVVYADAGASSPGTGTTATATAPRSCLARGTWSSCWRRSTPTPAGRSWSRPPTGWPNCSHRAAPVSPSTS